MEYYITLLPQISLMRTATADMTSWYDVCTSSAQSHDTGEAALCWGGDQELTISTNLHWPDKYAHWTPEYGTYCSAVLSIRNGTAIPCYCINWGVSVKFIPWLSITLTNSNTWTCVPHVPSYNVCRCTELRTWDLGILMGSPDSTVWPVPCYAVCRCT